MFTWIFAYFNLVSQFLFHWSTLSVKFVYSQIKKNDKLKLKWKFVLIILLNLSIFMRGLISMLRACYFNLCQIFDIVIFIVYYLFAVSFLRVRIFVISRFWDKSFHVEKYWDIFFIFRLDIIAIIFSSCCVNALYY